MTYVTVIMIIMIIMVIMVIMIMIIIIIMIIIMIIIIIIINHQSSSIKQFNLILLLSYRNTVFDHSVITVNAITPKPLDGLFSNLVHTLIVLVP